TSYSVYAVKVAYGTQFTSAGTVVSPAVNAPKTLRVGASGALRVLYTGKNAAVEVSVNGGPAQSVNTEDSTTASFDIATTGKGVQNWTVRVNGVALPGVQVTIK
ncbi:MAG: hypothetical protein EB027_08025, partial [Actinobacteria bacterium]|nr:hypothetical protein [Actinomycetota bacterium]